MKQLNIHFWLLLVTGINHVMAQNSSGDARFGASCGYLAKKIFCFGGSDSISTSAPSDAMHMLDLSNFNTDKPEEFESKWIKVDTDTKTQNILPRRYPQSTQLPDGKTLLVVGGEIYGNSSGVPQTLSFNGETLSWTTYQNFEDPPAQSRQIFDAASVYIPKYGFVLYGGLGIDNLAPYNETAENYINGYTEIEVLDIGNTENPWRPNISASEDVGRVDYRQAAIFDDKMNIILFFGGRRPGFTDPYDDLPGFKTIDLYNFTSQSWGRKTMWGQGPAPRYGHSATLVGPNQRHVLIYGGQNDDSDRPLADYCYILDLDSYQWTPQVIPVDAGVNLARSRHSAIAITNSTLFIVYGTETETKLAENILILDVKEPLMITLLNKLNSSAASPTDTVPGSSDTDADNPRKGLTSAATIGIGVGVSVAGLMILAVIIFCIIKKRRSKKKEKTGVDWDKIQDNYAEEADMYLPKDHFTHAPHIPNNTSAPGASSVLDSSAQMSSKGKLERPDTVDPRSADSVHGDEAQKPNTKTARRDQVQKPDIH